jgi:hypothetical protein
MMKQNQPSKQRFLDAVFLVFYVMQETSSAGLSWLSSFPGFTLLSLIEFVQASPPPDTETP